MRPRTAIGRVRLRAGELAARPVARRGPLAAARCTRRPAGRTRSSAPPTCSPRTPARCSRAQAAASPLMRGVAAAAALARATSGSASRRAPDRMNDPVLRRNMAPAGRPRLAVRAAGLRRPDGGRGARSWRPSPTPRSCSCTPACSSGRRAGRRRAWTRGMRAARRAAQRRGQADRPGHVRAPRRPGPDRPGDADDCLELFGADRCMWGSNFPIERLWTDFGTLVRTLARGPRGVPGRACRRPCSAECGAGVPAVILRRVQQSAEVVSGWLPTAGASWRARSSRSTARRRSTSAPASTSSEAGGSKGRSPAAASRARSPGGARHARDRGCRRGSRPTASRTTWRARSA